MQSKNKQAFKQRYIDKWFLSLDQVKVTGTDENGEATEYYEGVGIFVSNISRDEIVPALIRQKYTADDETKMLRLSIANPADADFVVYNDYVEDCRLVGRIITKALPLTEMTVAELDRTARVYSVDGYPDSALKANKLAYLAGAL